MPDISTATTSVPALVADFSPGVLALLGSLLFLIALGLAKSKDVLIRLLIALYIAAFITAQFPLYEFIAEELWVTDRTTLTLFVFGLSASITLLSLRRYIGSTYQHHVIWRTVEVIILALVIVGFTGAILHHLVGGALSTALGPVAGHLFSSPLAYTAWLIAPLAVFPLFIRPS